MDAKKGEAMTPERIDELARECAAKLSQPQYDMITSAEEEDRIRSDALDADAKTIAQALRTVALEVLEYVAVYCQDDADKKREYARRKSEKESDGR